MEYKPSADLVKMTQNNIVWALIGLIFGLALNWLSIKLFDKLNITNRYIKVLIQTVIIGFGLAFVHTTANNYFGWTWQNVTEGLFFVSLFFGVQYDLYSNVQVIANGL